MYQTNGGIFGVLVTERRGVGKEGESLRSSRGSILGIVPIFRHLSLVRILSGASELSKNRGNRLHSRKINETGQHL